MSTVAAEHDLLGRLGGDEFAILADAGEWGNQTGARLARRLVDAMEAPFSVGGTTIRVSCSIGIAHSPEDAGCAENLMRLGDIAL